MNEKFAFLTSTRFWALVIGALSTTFLDPSIMEKPWYVVVGRFLGIVSAGFIGIKSVDRFSEQIGNKTEIEVTGEPCEPDEETSNL